LSRLQWRCRRGTRELDELLQRYLHRRYPQADETERAAFERLLELQDPVLQDYLAGAARPQEREFDHVIQRILQPDA
jgi:antitoxin CptB